MYWQYIHFTVMGLSLECTSWWWNCPAETCRVEMTVMLSTVSASIWCSKWTHCRSQRLHGLSGGSVAACLLGLRVRIPPGSWMSVVTVVCCQVEVCATCWSLVQRSPTERGVSECDRESSTMGGPSSIVRRPCPTGGCCTVVKKMKTLIQNTRNNCDVTVHWSFCYCMLLNPNYWQN